MADEKKIKHLELIQAVINRLANNSFLVKGWCVTLVAAVLGLLSKDTNKRLIIIVYFPIIMFWILDAYFLYQEKLFRNLYDKVRNTDNEQINLSMNAHEINENKINWIDSFFSNTMLLFYGIMALISLLAISLFFNWI
ncbi:MAG TPA: hypothetical protein VGC97_15440 [Pyrinomonadaceae bacterium]|jgi:hypothetical protein